MKPVIALVGRPNVGKSTLFNRMTKSRDAIVADFSGLTRDRHYGDGRSGEHEFIVVDTGGFEPDSTTGIVKEMAKQTRQAVAEADAVIFVVDVRGGLSAQRSNGLRSAMLSWRSGSKSTDWRRRKLRSRTSSVAERLARYSSLRR